MALTETFITLDEYVNKRNDQGRLLKAEFTKLHTKIDRVDKKIDGVEDSLLKTINKVETDIVQLKGQFERMDAQAHNSRVVNPAARLKPVPAYSPLRGVIWPEVFPRSGGEFFKMRDDPKKRGMLTYLVKFYDIEGYEAWGQEEEEWEQEEQRRRPGESQDCTAAEDMVQSSTQDSLPSKSLRHEGQDSIVGEDRAHSSSQGSMPSNRPPLSLTDAVIQYPERLVEELVPMVGIIEENFTRSQERAAEFRMQSALRSAKRRLEGSQGTREEPPK
jgi:hypothetical protein